MLGLRIYSVALVCLIGLLGGCSHTTSIKASKESKPIYLTTVCIPVWTAVGALGGVATIAQAGASGDLTPSILLNPLVGVAGGGVLDFVRCGWKPPKLTNEHPDAERRSKVKEYKPRKVEEYKGYKRNKYKARPAARCGKRKKWSYRLNKCVRK